MYLKCHKRFKSGKEHRYRRIVEKLSVSGDRTVDRYVLYLGEINDSQREAWLKKIEAFDEDHCEQRKLALFPADRPISEHARAVGVQVRMHREWYHRSAMGDLLNEGVELAGKDNLYHCLDRLLEHKVALFGFLNERWQDLFGVKFDILLYDLTSTNFENDPPFPDGDKRRFGYSRDHCSDCVQVVIALIVTPEGFRSPTK
jgi:hypothetical protein